MIGWIDKQRMIEILVLVSVTITIITSTATAFSYCPSMVQQLRHFTSSNHLVTAPFHSVPHRRSSNIVASLKRTKWNIYAKENDPENGDDNNRINEMESDSIVHTTIDDSTKNIKNNIKDISSTPRLQYAAYDMVCAGIVGVTTGIVVATFKLSIESVRVTTYSWNGLEQLHNEIGAILIPVVGGVCVGGLIASGPFSPGLRGKVSQIEDIPNSNNDNDNVAYGNNIPMANRIQQQIPLLRKTTAAICTLGTGCSLGPEGPCVELGMGISRSCMDLFDRRPVLQSQEYPGNGIFEAMGRSTWNRILLSCGAAAGVSAGFNAPVAGVFFVLEVMQAAFNDVGIERRRQELQEANDESVLNRFQTSPVGLFSSSATLSPVLLSSVLAALCARSILGNQLTFNVANAEALSASPLIELPMFLVLGSICGIVAFIFSQSAKLSRSLFAGEIGNETIRTLMQSLSPNQKPIIGGLFCGVTALYFPQVLFFGYETLNSLLSNTVSVPTNTLISLLIVKSLVTAVCIGSGLVGGTLAPALFLGGVTGASFHNIISDMYQFLAIHSDGINSIMNAASSLSIVSGAAQNTFVLTALPDYAMVGSASVLAALFRAPLTASLLLFELTRDYDIILPILASAGVGTVVADILEDAFTTMNKSAHQVPDATTQATLRTVRRDQDSASWGDLADKDDLEVMSNANEQKE